ncbi:tail fiber domain-containing protein [Lutibacter citreus]|uniref:tail fiber domain-containing protein n=1 Tax=Lutibacter citreus TaxID=2138210 RepID=UPI000DBE5F78|nr:tail fiber domain-containing protein [Lutibacter citreus]
MKILPFLIIFCAINSFSQVGINTDTPDASSILDVTSSDKGILVPRISLLSTTDKTTITAPLTSLLIYNTASVSDVKPGYYYWNGLEWSQIATTKTVDNAWSTLGTSGTDDTVNFIGTTDDEDLVFKRNNIPAGVLGSSNAAFGVLSLASNTSGYDNASIGLNSLRFNTEGHSNTALGKDALLSNGTGSSNTATGVGSLSGNTTGSSNTANGSFSLAANNTGTNNTAVGSFSLNKNNLGNDNTAIGYNSLTQNTEGIQNTASGAYSLFDNLKGNNNTASGYNSLSYNKTGANNTAMGSGALNNLVNLSGNNNTALGYNALITNTTGSNNTAIGYNANVPDGALDNQVRIGNADVTYAGVQVGWTVTSDRRLKNTIEDSDLGLDFINQLRPVSYYRNNDKHNKLEYGFIAQELKEALKNSSSKTNGIITEDTEGMLSVRYNDLMSPMVKAIQEQNKEIELLKSENETLKLKQLSIENELKEIKSLLLNKQ